MSSSAFYTSCVNHEYLKSNKKQLKHFSYRKLMCAYNNLSLTVYIKKHENNTRKQKHVTLHWYTVVTMTTVRFLEMRSTACRTFLIRTVSLLLYV